MLERAEFWTHVLWQNYLPQLQSGAPFYLAADSNLIGELLQQNEKKNATIIDALDDFHTACRFLLTTASTGARVNQVAFDKLDGKFYSRIICLAVQQVLIVELMLHDDQFSEQSYFPRYRKCLHILRGLEHENPLGTDFRRIWQCLESEVNLVPGNTSSSITFGPGTGRTKNSNFPLSQALFTRHDLTIIREKASWLGETSNNDEVIQSLYQIRRHLGRRAQQLISKGTLTEQMRARLCKQVQAFLFGDCSISVTKNTPASSPPASMLVAYLDGDFFDEQFSVYLRSEAAQISGESVVDAINTHISQCTGTVKTILLAAREDRYEEVTRNNPFIDNDTILAIIKSDQQASFKNTFASMYNCAAVPYPSSLPETFSLLYCGSVPDQRLADAAGISVPQTSESRIELAGGVLADARSLIYLCGYPPDAIKHGGLQLSVDSAIVVNGKTTEVGAFLKELRTQRAFVSYVIQVSGNELQFALASKKTNITPRALGFLVSNDELRSVCDELDVDQPALQGTCFRSRLQVHQDQRISLADLLILSARGKRIRVSEKTSQIVVAAINSFEGASQLRRITADQIARTSSVPLNACAAGLISRLTHA